MRLFPWQLIPDEVLMDFKYIMKTGTGLASGSARSYTGKCRAGIFLGERWGRKAQPGVGAPGTGGDGQNPNLKMFSAAAAAGDNEEISVDITTL